jgi:regulator of protease activity HflC (stomatin/prohibitin superfamily)
MARQVIPIDVRTKKLEMVVEAASKDLQIMDVTGVLNYHLNPNEVGRLYQRVGLDFENIIIAPAMHEAIKAATSGYRVEDVLVLRAELKERIQQNLSTRLAEMYITVDQFSLANVEFSSEFNQAIERKQIAEQAARQKEYELQSAQKDIEIAVARAEAEKESAIKAAEGAARARELHAEAEAAALALIGEQLRRNPSLIQYEWASRLAPGVRTVFLPADQSIILDAQPLLEPDRVAQPVP